MPSERTSRKRELNELFVKNAKVEKVRVEHRDTKVQGLVLRVSASGTKTFAVMLRDNKGKPQTYTLGHYPDLSLKEARAQAEEVRLNIRVQGVAPTSRAKRAVARSLSLRDLLTEAQPVLAKTRKGWKPRGPNGKNGNAYSTILAVFEPILDRAVETLDEKDIAAVVNAHRRSRPHDTKDTATGQVSRAMSYLSTVFDWVAGRGRFKKIGAGRIEKLSTPVIGLVHDPSDDDVTILGKRERVLSIKEIAAVWPLLQYPAPSPVHRDQIPAEDDYGPIAHKFILLTMCRVGEVSHTCWRDFDFVNGTWTRWVKAVEGQGVARLDVLPLSEPALALLKSLLGYTRQRPDDLVFPNSDGGVQSN